MAESQTSNEPYRVLARKYRPTNFDELIGQDALVRTLKNAIESGRIAHAFMLTGVRGVGKTTTARIIAKALNYAGADGKAGPTTGDTADCPTCQAITQDRHPDVIEMDAASRTGVDDIREILDGVRYAPTEARYKVYVIDEVHMLSKNAFNALLKTLEEPPEHVKFIFATTEIRKVPVTVLSRCQRFDLRRVDVPTLSAHFTGICDKEGVKAEDAAITAIARAADGSVRDGLSLLDQAIALSGEAITAQQVEAMLGLADRAKNLDVLEHALRGEMPEALAILDDLYANGSDPLAVVQDLLDLTHILTKLRAVPGTKSMKHTMAKDQTDRAAGLAAQLSMPSLAKAWQILLKGLSEVQIAPNPQNALEMVIIRLVYAADLPDPKDLLRQLKDGGGSVSTSSHASISAPVSGAQTPVHAQSFAPPSVSSGGASGGGAVRAALAVVPDAPAPIVQIKTFEDVVALLEQENEVLLASQVYQYAHPVKLEPKPAGGLLEIRPQPEAPQKLAPDLGAALSRICGQRWVVSVSSASGGATLAQQREAAKDAAIQEVLQTPIIRDILSVFPDAELIGIQDLDNKDLK
ncbi:MAG: DNA polymerase III subunit gamma/tau [Bdellovibrionales bacterium]